MDRELIPAIPWSQCMDAIMLHYFWLEMKACLSSRNRCVSRGGSKKSESYWLSSDWPPPSDVSNTLTAVQTENQTKHHVAYHMLFPFFFFLSFCRSLQTHREYGFIPDALFISRPPQSLYVSNDQKTISKNL